jgi:hypothetical protein
MDRKTRDEKAFTFLGVILNGNEKILKELLVFENSEPYLHPFVLTYGFLGAIKNNKKKCIPMLLDYFIASDIKSYSNYSYLNIVFNVASECNNIDLMNKLDKQFSIMENTLKEPTDFKLYINDTVYAKLDSIGKTFLYPAPRLDLSLTERKMSEYSLQPLRFSAKNFNGKVLDNILNGNYEINPMQLEKVILESIANENPESSLYFVLNDKTRQIMKNSSIINLCLNEKTTLSKIKDEVLKALTMVELKEELPHNNIKQNKTKI